MKTFGNVDIAEGGEIGNLTVASDSQFPMNPNDGELFFINSDVHDNMEGLHIYHKAWIPIVNSTILVGQLDEALVPNTLQLSSSAQMNINTTARVGIPWNIEIIRDQDTYEVDPSDTTIIKFTASGEYEVSYKVSHYLTKSDANIMTVANFSGVELDYTVAFAFARNTKASYGSNTATFIVKAGDGDFLTINASRVGKNGTVMLIGEQSSISIKRVK